MIFNSSNCMARFRSIGWAIVFLSTPWVLSSCATEPPLEQFTLARAALNAARDVDSTRFSPGHFHRAEEQFRLGEKNYRDEDYAEAKKNFEEAIYYAEQAENSTRLKKFKTGESFP